MNRREFFSTIAKPSTKGAAQPTGITHPPAVPSLAPWQPTATNPWDRNAVLHFYQRLGFGISWSEMTDALARDPSSLLDDALDDFLLSPEGMPAIPDGWEKWLYEAPYSGNDHIGYEDQESLYQTGKADIRLWWTTLMTDPALFLREKLAFLWSNHFVTEMQRCYYPKHVYRYLDVLRRYAWGNVKQFIKDMAIEPAMLLYLDGENSTSDSLNENFGREVMEIMLMGRVDRYGNPNYTQDDVRAVSAAVCGWRYWIEAPPPDIVHNYFAEYYFDFQTKTSPFGVEPKVHGLFAAKEKGLFLYLDGAIEADIFDVMFDKRGEQIAWHIAETIYKAFLTNDTSASESIQVIEALAQILQDSDWELKPMLQTFFLSEHFFDPVFRGAMIKSPYEYMLCLFRSLDLPVSRSAAGVVAWHGVDLAQWLMNPPNVKGWIGGRDWINSATLPKRNLVIATALTVGGRLDGGDFDAHTGYFFEPFEWKDDAVQLWAEQLPGFTDSLPIFLESLLQLLLTLKISEDEIDLLLRKIGIGSQGDWQRYDIPEKITATRKIVNQIMLLPHYQLQ